MRLIMPFLSFTYIVLQPVVQCMVGILRERRSPTSFHGGKNLGLCNFPLTGSVIISVHDKTTIIIILILQCHCNFVHVTVLKQKAKHAQIPAGFFLMTLMQVPITFLQQVSSVIIQ